MAALQKRLLNCGKSSTKSVNQTGEKQLIALNWTSILIYAKWKRFRSV